MYRPWCGCEGIMPCIQLVLLGALLKAMSGSYIHMTVQPHGERVVVPAWNGASHFGYIIIDHRSHRHRSKN